MSADGPRPPPTLQDAGCGWLFLRPQPRAEEATERWWHRARVGRSAFDVARLRRRCGRLTRVKDTEIGGDLARVLFTAEQIAERMRELAAEIDRDYDGKDLLLVGVLNGAVMVMADLSRAPDEPLPDGLDGHLLLRLGHPVLRRGPHPQGPQHRHQRDARAGGGGHHRHRADPVAT